MIKAADVKISIMEMLKNVTMALTTNHWTSVSKESYSALTAHFIDENWVLCSTSLGCFGRTGTSKAEDVVKELVAQLEDYGISLANVIAVVTDTEPTMVLFGEWVLWVLLLMNIAI